MHKGLVAVLLAIAFSSSQSLMARAAEKDIVVPGTDTGVGPVRPPSLPEISDANPKNSPKDPVIIVDPGSDTRVGPQRPSNGVQPLFFDRPPSHPQPLPKISEFPSAAAASAVPKPVASPNISDFRDSETGLVDCDTPFDDLAIKSPTCKSTLPGRRCEQYSHHQFPEVVKITIRTSICSGTVIASKWILTAAHCFNELEASILKTGVPGKDWVLTGPEADQTEIIADNAMTISLKDSTRTAERILVYHGYTGYAIGQPPPFLANDLALIEIAEPFPKTAVEPARLATKSDLQSNITIAGYGYSTANNGDFGQFYLTWPKGIRTISSDLQFEFTSGSAAAGTSAFCQGDSGGPVFSRIHRGCSKAVEARPRPIQGVISYNYSVADADAPPTAKIASCQSNQSMVMQSTLPANIRDWICSTTSSTVGGC